MRRDFYRFLRLGIPVGIAFWLLAGCGIWHHTHGVKSYDKAISDDERDPTYHEDPQRADEEVRDVQ